MRIISIILVLFYLAFRKTSAYEGYLFYLNFFNLTDASIPNTLTDKFFQEIFISGDVGTTVIVQNVKSRTKQTRKLVSNNQTIFIEFDEELGGNNQRNNNASIIVSSIDGPISVQANKATRDSGDGYLAFPLADTSTEYFLAAYTNVEGLPSLFTITSISDGTCIDLMKVDKDGLKKRINHLSLDANEVFYGSMESDVTGIYVSSSKPIAVTSGNLCVKIPVGRDSCDHIIEQMLPIKEWGSIHVASSLQGVPWNSGFIVRVISAVPQNVSITERNFTLINPISSTTTINITSVSPYNFIEYFVRGNINGPSVVTIDCPSKCLVMQYGLGAIENGSDTFGSKPDPFMMTVPSIDGYGYSAHFSTSHLYKLIDNNGAFELEEAINFLTIIIKGDKISQVNINGGPLPFGDQSTASVVHQYKSQTYTIVLFPITHGFHSVTSGSDSVAVFVYGFGSKSNVNSGNPTGYGYLGNYKYGSGSSLIRSGPWFDITPFDNNNNNNIDQENSNAIVVTMNDMPSQIGIWNTTFCTIYPLDNIIKRKCSEGYSAYFDKKRVSFVQNKIRDVCANATVSMSLLPVQYTEYTCGRVYILIKVTGIGESTLRSVSDCMDSIDSIVTPLHNWMESGKYKIDKVIDPSDDVTIQDCSPVHFRTDERFTKQAIGWTCPKTI